MTAQDKVTATLLRLKEFISNVSLNYLCWCQSCEIEAQKVAGGAKMEHRFWYKVENDKEKAKEEMFWHVIFL